MDNLSFAPLDPGMIAKIEQWLEPSAIDTLLKQSEPMPFTGVEQGTAHGWAALQGGTPIAVATIRLENSRTGYVDMFVKPSERRQGVGSALLSYILEQPAVHMLSSLHATAEFDNTAGQKVLSRHGFVNAGYTEDNRVLFEKR